MFTTDQVNLYNRNIFKTSLYIYIFQDEKFRFMRNLSLSMVSNLQDSMYQFGEFLQNHPLPRALLQNHSLPRALFQNHPLPRALFSFIAGFSPLSPSFFLNQYLPPPVPDSKLKKTLCIPYMPGNTYTNTSSDMFINFPLLVFNSKCKMSERSFLGILVL